MTNINDFELPQFSHINPDKLVSELGGILEQNRSTLKQVLANDSEYDWENLVVPLEQMEDRLSKFWSPVRHLHSVADNTALRTAYNTCLEMITAYSTDLMLNHDLYLAYRQISRAHDFSRLDPAQQKVIENMLRDFILSGVGLEQGHKEKYRAIARDLSSLESRFEENVLDATQGWFKHVSERSLLGGLPEHVIDLAARNAEDRQLDGWVLTLDFPCYYPVMQYADTQALREEMYQAYVSRASDEGPASHEWDNGKLMQQIMSLRSEKAKLLGFDTYAHYSLERKMADSPGEVLGFLEQLLQDSIAPARSEFDEVVAYAREHDGHRQLAPWDVGYYSEKLRQHKFDISQETLKPWFPVPAVLNGLFELIDRLYGITVKELGGVDVWHPDVHFYQLTDRSGIPRGGFYLDIYARQQKRGGAWMDECVVRKNLDGDLQRPVAYLSCNFTPPVQGRPSLLTHDEVTTLFHEFGHGLQHMLTLVDYPPVSGINGVPWDAVELPSQFMENWCWERESLDLFARHHETGDPLPEELFNRMLEAKNFQSAMQMVRQLEFAIFDFRLHYEDNDYTTQSIQGLLDEIRTKTAVIKPPAYNRFQNSFAHIFSGGYAAGYYSYKWAEVLSADAYSKFEENGVFDRDTGEAFLHTVLEQGGSRDPMDLFMEFRGRKPEISALLRHSGIQPTEQSAT